MKSFQEIIASGRRAVLHEAEAIKNLEGYINEDFAHCVELIYQSKGRVVITGIGKSANISQKIVATLNSTGTPAIFMHAADAIHGDLGIVQKNDVVICVSRSGDTAEIKVLIPLLKTMGNKLIAMVSNTHSVLAQQADYILNAYIEKEACPNNLAPTSSTTAQLVMGDALAIALLEYREFSSSDFAKYHPGGTLGKKLYLRVSDLYHNNEKPQIQSNSSIDEVIMEMTTKRLGATSVLDENGKLVGIITDGDLRRMLVSKRPVNQLKAFDIMGKNPRTIEESELAVTAFQMMEQNNITQLIVVNQGKYVGMIHIHDILKEGIV
ncbi:MAG TPA: D-arabinose 5-phosphate isomerase [Marinilabiliales bacterium]|jgi:arabinose-5-phosphate isomerase|nr:KpsF/GutQ family sugar-phosphate isomerase [Salinivirgaceae bacterium]OFX39866.1 MAG: D-arabinose 5-phosphate isomerase [Bacteroidetes bacterium GWA2_40_14]OFX59908.1 MAG: D-arabinose 5-phosphate isomerase [Bacteroidetes bacterium GWC2_40_13]OFX75131.1 MAG: D-arabinose 5-phosphate isomerase [Bacteroidetes bacterium GWD2_40_43]OFX93820.1 MAG: D-arabinose 5-phosphate isomerase [Bacteroidetes bacterium GWE2_40_63]OFY18107.1 MAG: D-arabinose 5-phosphate isomerase [Bacteroidetes bacterium GWF2_4